MVKRRGAVGTALNAKVAAQATLNNTYGNTNFMHTSYNRMPGQFNNIGLSLANQIRMEKERQSLSSGGYVRDTLAVLHKGERVLGVRQATILKGALKRKPYKTVRVRKGTVARVVPESGRIGVTGLYKVRPGQYIIPS